MSQSIGRQREDLEDAYIDYLRREYPTFEKFQAYATERFQRDTYVIRDETLDWPRDIRACVMSHLSLPEIARLAKTSTQWRVVLTSPSYNIFWQARYLRDFPTKAPTGNGTAIPFNSDMVPPQSRVPKRPKKFKIEKELLKRVLWSDLYLYCWSRTQHFFPLGKRSLKTFLEAKYGLRVPKDFPEIELRMRPDSVTLSPSHFPKDILEFANVTRKGISAAFLASLLMKKAYLESSTEAKFEHNNSFIELLPSFNGKSLENIFREESVLYLLLLHSKPMWSKSFPSTQSVSIRSINTWTLEHILALSLIPKNLYELQWEYFFSELST
jgi:hypothetical protein